MLRHCLTALCALLLLVACQVTGPDADADADAAPPRPIMGAEITVTALDAPPSGAPPETLQTEDGAGLVTADHPAPPVVEPVAETASDAAPPAEAVIPAAAVVPAAEIVPAEAVIPAVLKSPEQLRCERRDGTWARAGKSEARTCVKQTRDGGKQCSKGTQCEGLCLARSGTCAPFAPLFGCNEIFEDDGRRMTLCID